MIKHILSKVLVAAAVVFALATPAAAQGTGTSETAPSVGVGLVINKWVEFDDFTSKGIHADFHKPLNRPGLGLVVDVSFAKDEDETDTTVGGGVRYTVFRSGNTRVFVQGTVGLVRFSVDEFSDSAFYVAPGGGVLFGLNDKVDIKAQIDFLINNGWETDDGNIFRFIIGVNFPIGR